MFQYRLFYLNEAQQVAKNLNSTYFRVWQCSNCDLSNYYYSQHEVHIRAYRLMISQAILNVLIAKK